MSKIHGLTDIPEYVSKEVIAQILGITARQIARLVENGVLIQEKEGNRVKFNMVDSVRRYCQYQRDKAAGKDIKKTEEELKAQKLKAEIALKESQGELHRLRTEIARGNYIPVEEIKADYSRFFIVLKNFLNGLPGKLSGRLTGFIAPVEVRSVEKDMQKDINSALSEFVSRATVRQEPSANINDGITPKKKGRPPKNANKEV